ncbi:MAG TPA: AmpG family muropeptide MFS transporter [Noviherbaspirillum sp.]|uniref:AmpG family muropeptide MFS transporter n=1 Tax=Noviherbaspirillum sp. TaxID=1926288 RepID=UPI002B48E61A|nr:AmpG family muropeptide MFS transporter [Noviherbaspirillum sp.]HJV87302.1 AmpG family muropeptide MFS transporter [Noviherbaspirillum sp.]
MLICVSLGFSSGLPLFILYNLLSAWLKSENVDLKAIGLFALVGFPYTWKFAWSPLMDRFHIPLLGRRRGWMLVTQIALLVAVAALGQFSPKTDLTAIVFLCGAVAFLSASQDIVIDAYRRELLTDEQQGSGTALFVNAYKLSTLVPGALSLILSDLMSWQSVFIITALFMLPGIVTTLIIAEPKIYGQPPKNLREAVALPFKEFIHRSGWSHALLVLAFIFLYKLGDSMATALATPFYIDLGFTRTQIGLVAKNAGLWASLSGGILGAIWLEKTGINRGLWIFGVLQALAILGFAALAQTGVSTGEHATLMLGAVIGLEAFAVGLGTAAFTAYIATTTDPRYTATQFALFTSLAAVPRTFFNAATGYIVAQTGWFTFFLVCFALALPGMMMLPKIAPWNGDKK